MNTEIMQITKEVGRHRRTIYLNERRVKGAYINSGGIDQLGTIDSTEHGMQFGLSAWLATISAIISRNKQHSEMLQIGDHPELMASLLEASYAVSRELIVLSLEHAPRILPLEYDPHDEQEEHEPVLLKFSGPSFFTTLGESLFTGQNYSKLTRVFSDADIRTVEETRRGQENTLRKRKTPEESVTVWIAARVNDPTKMAYTSIAAREFLEPLYDTIMHEPQPISMGILGSRESVKDRVVFIHPMWIWQEI